MIHRDAAIGWLVVLAVSTQIVVFILNPEVTVVNHAVNWVAMGITGFYWGMKFERKFLIPRLTEAQRIANAYRKKDGLTALEEAK